jgi:PPOX class probable F420-dependent enzyme
MAVIPETHRDLLDAKILTLATIAPDGRPQLSAVWFLAEDETVRLSLNTSRKKVRNLRLNSACTVFILDLANPARYLEIRGEAEIEPDDDYDFAARLGAKYVADVRLMDQPGEGRVAVTVHPTTINAVDMSR